MELVNQREKRHKGKLEGEKQNKEKINEININSYTRAIICEIEFCTVLGMPYFQIAV